MITAFFLFTANASADGHCGTADALAALQGHAAAQHVGMLEAPDRLFAPDVPPPGADKVVYGGHYEFFIDTPNFTVNWWDARISTDAGQRAAAALEEAWTAFIEQQGWTPPVSSDTYLLWVLLDPSLGGTTGYTTEYVTDDFPDGYPVIYMNPDWAHSEAFWSSLAAHEFMHAIQYAMRDWSQGGSTAQSWYWEASATHASELANPTWDGHQYTSAWYAEQPAEAVDSYAGGHQYGMFVLNTWLDEQAEGTMHDVWRTGVSRPADTWDVLIADTTALPLSSIWAGFTGAYGNNELAESDLFVDVITQGDLTDGATGALGYLGSDYYTVPTDVHITIVEGDVVLGGANERMGTEMTAPAGSLVSVTALQAGETYVLALSAPQDPDQDSGLGNQDTGDGDPDTDVPADTAEDETTEDAGCDGCSAGPQQSGWLGWLLASVVVWRRTTRWGRR